ncbi:MAG: CDP-diacylglycerol--glycerol-3-phosphate 3-phosphatidyltransferase [Acidimicrobiaceae bacterium]|nr:CDP-diacylglycerol--glycerol-3-phosphate 3-phosphatidyltransferase [Acidimicrobiaceae bacterium]
MSELRLPRSVGITHPANLLTVTRLLFAPLLFWLVLAAQDTRGASWVVFGLGIALASTDFLDGKVARRANVVSRSGAFLDPLADKVVIIGSAFCLVAVQRYWWLPVALITARELAITAWRSRWARRGLALPARRSAKYKTLVQAAALAFAVAPPLQTQDALIAVVLWVAVVWTLVSGAQYLLDGQNALSSSGE